MGKLIQDIGSSVRWSSEVPSYLRGYGQKAKARQLPTEVLVTELWKRGVSISDIFGQFYALEMIEDAKHDDIFGDDEEGLHGRPRLTLNDAELAGRASPTKGVR